MPVRSLCQKFFRDAFAPFHQYRQRAILDATAALSRGASLTLTSIGRYLPGNAQVKNKIKRIDRLLGNDALHRDIPAIFQNITRLLTRDLTLCVIAIDWNGYPSQAFHVLRASLVCYRRSIPLMSQVVPSSRQQHTQVHKAFLDALAAAIWPDKKLSSSLMPDSRAPGFVMSAHWAGILLAGYGETSSSGWIACLKDG